MQRRLNCLQVECECRGGCRLHFIVLRVLAPGEPVVKYSPPTQNRSHPSSNGTVKSISKGGKAAEPSAKECREQTPLHTQT
eukprot:4577113-Amphidinium_carterae.1